MNLNSLIPIIPDLINLFLSGFILISIYDWIRSKKRDASVIAVISIIISFLIKTFYSAIHIYVFPNTEFVDPVKVVIYVITATILPFLIVKLQEYSYSSDFFKSFTHKSFNDSLFRDLIDTQKGLIICTYLKGGKHIIGQFTEMEERHNYSYIAMINYHVFDADDQPIIVYGDDENAAIIICVNDIEMMEIIYSENSHVWERIKPK